MTAQGSSLPLAITGIGTAVPDRVVTNRDLEGMLDTSDEWIRTRSGITERRWAEEGTTTASLAAAAVNDALKDAGRTPDEVGLFVLASCTPDQRLPQTSAVVCDAVGLRCGAFDLNAACAGFVDALVVGTHLLATAPGPVVVAGAERLTSLFDPTDRSTAVLFGDGAAAVVLEPGSGALLGWDAGTDGSLKALLEVPPGGFLQMDGPEVFRRAVRVVVASAETALARAGVDRADVDVFLPHQANARIIEAARTRIGIPAERTMLNLERYGNTSAASVPLLLADALAAGRIESGSIVLTAGFGAGMTWSSAVVRWA